MCPADLVPFEPWKIDAISVDEEEQDGEGRGKYGEGCEQKDEVGIALRELMMAPIVGMGRF